MITYSCLNVYFTFIINGDSLWRTKLMPLKFGTQADNNCTCSLFVGYFVTSKAANMLAKPNFDIM